jgi:hypothetical protein
LTVPGAGVVNGTTLTGSQALRLYTNTRNFVADGNVGALADFLNRSTNVTGRGGGFIGGGLPQDFLVFNPQFQSIGLNGNLGNSTYHSLQVQATKRLSYGLTGRVGYTWSKTIGISNDDNNVDARDPRNINLDKSVVGYHRGHSITSNSTWNLPLGANRAFLAGAPNWAQKIVANWQLGGLFSWTSGAPLAIRVGNGTSGLLNIWQSATNTPDLIGALPEAKLTKNTDGSLPTLFPGLTQATDPGRSGVTTVNSLQNQFTLRAMVDAQGNPVLVNPAPGKIGTLGVRRIEGPSRLDFDANLLKRVQITETKEFEFRVDVVNVLNHANFENPTAANLDINSTQFGRFTEASTARRFTIGARLNF